MQVIYTSRQLAVAISTALDPSGREHLIIVAKATWSLPQPGQRPAPQAPQPLSYTDQFYGEPGNSPLRYGDDFALYKPRCDVLFDACAHAPDGKAVTAMAIEVEVAGMCKLIKVMGPRTWKRSLGLYSPGKAEPFTHLPLHYGLAFGGTHRYTTREGQELVDTYLDNPTGLGWAGPHTKECAKHAALPCLETFTEPTLRPDARYPAVALSAVARNWPQRLAYAGTYDGNWHANQFPFLPEDFDARYHQCAPLDQQIDYPSGGERVRLTHVLAGRRNLAFRLPGMTKTVRVLRKDYSVETLQAVVDTLYFETEQNRFSAVWRTSTPIRRRIQEFDTIVVGPVDPAWWEAKTLGVDGSCLGCQSIVETVR